MFGDEPTEVDCAIFGQVSQVKYHVPDAVKAKQFLKGRVIVSPCIKGRHQKATPFLVIKTHY